MWSEIFSNRQYEHFNPHRCYVEIEECKQQTRVKIQTINSNKNIVLATVLKS